TPRWRLSPRRKAPLATVLLAMVAMLALRWMCVAGCNGTQPREMDWNDGGRAARADVLQGFTVVGVEESREGPRTCRRYARLGRGGEPFRVECRVVLAPDADDAGR